MYGVKQKKGVCYYYIIWFEKYHVIKILADKNNRTLYLTKHNMLNCYRVIKRIHKSAAMSQSFFNEVNSLKNLRHPNFPIIYDIEEDKEFYYIIEEYIEGESLRTYRVYQNNILESKIIDFAIQLCDVIEALHSRKESILYLDLKPDNIIVCGDVLKLIDFGTAILEKDAPFQNISYGTKGYAAPEQYFLNEIDKRSDIYGIGSVLFFLIAGYSFRNTEEDIRVCKALSMYSSHMKNLILHCLKTAPSQRYQSVAELKQELLHLQQSYKSITPLCFVIAGADRRMGTTHFAIMLTNYLNRYIGDALYIETENRGVIRSIKGDFEKDIYFPSVVGTADEMMEKYSDYQFYICDCGVWTEHKKIKWNYDAMFLMVGCKPWEIQCNEKLLAYYRDKAVFLANFQDKRFCWDKSIFSVPYEPNPFLLTEKQNKLIKECLKNTGCLIGQRKRFHLQKKLHWRA